MNGLATVRGQFSAGGRMAQPIKGIFFELTHPLSAHAKESANQLIRGWVVVVKSEIKRENAAISVGQIVEGCMHISNHGVLDKRVFWVKVVRIWQGLLKICIGIIIVDGAIE